MKKDLIYVSTVGMSEADWLAYRKTGVGASEVGKVLGVSEWGSAYDLFYEKIGEGLPYTVENLAMFMGKEKEPFIANLWQYWEGSAESMMRNYRAGRKVRRMRRVNAYVRNPKHPWLFCSLDRKINKTSTRGEGALELKTIGGFEANKWQAGVPPEYILQLQTQMGVCEFEYGELAVHKDGRDFDVLPFEFNPKIFEAIIEGTHDFWERVQRGRRIITQRFEAVRNFNHRLAQELEQELHEVEPHADGSIGLEDFLNERYKQGSGREREGTIQELQSAMKHKELKEEEKRIQNALREQENYLKSQMREATKITFGKDGYVSWSGEPRKFLNKVKI